jgi:putative FmdB family regulatory protein|tara:strand:- start:329 stop:565 length:237 start_codon:yes stop_codon:yes gene_type:complete
MPFYDYKCNKGHIFESMCSIADRKEQKECPECGAKSKHIFSVNKKYKPSFGNNDTRFNQREKHRKSMTESQMNQSYKG